MDPNTATDTAATMMVFILLPSHTMSRGARADLGRLFKSTRNGSSTWATLLLDHKSRAQARPKTVQSAKLIRVSSRVTPVWRNRLPSRVMVTRHLAIMVGELKMKLSIQCIKSMMRQMVTCRWRRSSPSTKACWATDISQVPQFFLPCSCMV